MYPYYLDVFGGKDATRLVNIYAIIYGCGGFISALLGGYLCDRIGVIDFTLSLVGLSFFSTALVLVESFASQVRWWRRV
jgi:predicted MFS family arabinose efflux permease